MVGVGGGAMPSAERIAVREGTVEGLPLAATGSSAKRTNIFIEPHGGSRFKD
jgi:hypothetical protein